MREEVGVRAQLVNVEPVLLAVGQTAPDECLQKGRLYVNVQLKRRETVCDLSTWWLKLHFQPFLFIATQQSGVRQQVTALPSCT